REVVRVRALPSPVVRQAPKPAIVGRAGIRKERYRLVGPYAGGLKPFAPSLDLGRIIKLRLDEVRLDERHVSLREEQPLGQLLGRKTASLVETIAPLRGEALNP